MRIYTDGSYDIVGTMIGSVSPNKIVSGENITEASLHMGNK